MFRRTLTAGRNLRVCIVGAGVTGLRAADILSRHGAQVTIFEARKRIGGRVGLLHSKRLGFIAYNKRHAGRAEEARRPPCRPVR